MADENRDLLDKLVIAFDRRQRRKLDIWEFSDDPECILRVGLTTARRGAELADGTVVRAGDTVGLLHLWNERIPQIPPGGPDLAWGRTFKHLLVHSLRLLARYMVEDHTLDEIEAFGGDFPFKFTPGAVNMLRRLGMEVFDPVPPHNLTERVIDFATRLWTWLMRRAFNPESIRGRRLRDIHRRPTWLSRRAFIAHHGPRYDPATGEGSVSKRP
jgi:hypothetical protein